MEAAGNLMSADCTTTPPPQQPGHSTPTSAPSSASTSSAQKRKLLFSSEESASEVEDDKGTEIQLEKSDVSFLWGAKVFKNFVVTHTACRTCDTPLECNIDVKGADSVIEVLCTTCEERFCTVNPEIQHL